MTSAEMQELMKRARENVMDDIGVLVKSARVRAAGPRPKVRQLVKYELMYLKKAFRTVKES